MTTPIQILLKAPPSPPESSKPLPCEPKHTKYNTSNDLIMRTRLAVTCTDSGEELCSPSPRSKHQTPDCCIIPGPPPHSPHPNSPRSYCKGCFGTYPADPPARSSKSQSRPLMLHGLDLSIANRFLAPRTRRRAGHYNETRLAREAAGLTSSVKHGSHGPGNPGSLPEVVVLSENSFLWWTCLGPPPTSRIQQLSDDDKDAYNQAWGNVLVKTRLSPVCKRFMKLWDEEAERLLEGKREKQMEKEKEKKGRIAKKTAKVVRKKRGKVSKAKKVTKKKVLKKESTDYDRVCKIRSDSDFDYVE